LRVLVATAEVERAAVQAREVHRHGHERVVAVDDDQRVAGRGLGDGLELGDLQAEAGVEEDVAHEDEVRWPRRDGASHARGEGGDGLDGDALDLRAGLLEARGLARERVEFTVGRQEARGAIGRKT